MQQNLIPVTAVMPLDLEQRARLEAARRRISRAELVRQAVAEFLRQLDAAGGEFGDRTPAPPQPPAVEEGQK